MIIRAVTHHLGLLVQQPLLSALRPLLQNFPQLLLQAAHSCSAETAAGLFGQLQYQVKQVCTPLSPAPLDGPPLLAFFQADISIAISFLLDHTIVKQPVCCSRTSAGAMHQQLNKKSCTLLSNCFATLACGGTNFGTVLKHHFSIYQLGRLQVLSVVDSFTRSTFADGVVLVADAGSAQ